MEYINQPLLSVIIPVFNVEGYLSKCIDSVLNNNFSSIEIILVNDGSTDNSGDVCNAYAEKFDFIYAFHKENQGVSSSRNYGLDKAIGEWIYFMDSDDWISSDTFTILKEKSEFDIIQFGYKKVNEQGNVLFEMVPSFEESFSNADKYQSDGKFSLMNIVVSFFKKDLIKENNIKFSNEIQYGEDLEFGVKCFAKAKHIYVLNEPFYNYLERKGSAMESNVSLKSVTDHLKIAQSIIDFYTNNDLLKASFFRFQLIYFVKSFFSRSLLLNNEINCHKILQDSYNDFYDRNIEYLTNAFFKISRFNIRLYQTILKIRRLI